MAAFELYVNTEVALRLSEARLAPQYHAMIERNRERVARWDRWAETPATETETEAWLAGRMAAFANGRAVPTVMVIDETLVGSMACDVDEYSGTASIGFWVDASVEGRGLVTASAGALLAYVIAEYDVGRVELRTAVDNLRSQSVARRLGFTLEGTLRSAMPRADTRVDQCIFTLLPGELTARR